MAGALLLLENSTRDIKTPGLSWKKQVDETIAGLRQRRAGETGGGMAGFEISDASLTDSEFKQLVPAVGGEVRVNLGKIEEALETFAAAPGLTGLLDAVPEHLNQIQGALQILGQAVAGGSGGVIQWNSSLEINLTNIADLAAIRLTLGQNSDRARRRRCASRAAPP